MIVCGEDLEPGEVTRALGVFPDRAWRRGDALDIRRPDGRRVDLDHLAKCGTWKKFMPEELNQSLIDEQLSYWIALLEPKTAAIQDFVSRDFDVELASFIASSGTERVSLDASLLASLADIGVGVEILFSP